VTAGSFTEPVHQAPAPAIPIETPTNGKQGDWVSDLHPKKITLSLPDQRFSPVEYHSFSIPAISAEFAVPDGWTTEAAVERGLEILARAQQACFERELVRYLENTMNAGRRAFDLQAEKQLPPRVPG
jgi:hypothetical protein